MATEFTKLEATLTVNPKGFDAGLAEADRKVVTFGAKTKVILSDVAKEFQTKFGYLPTIARREFSATTQATTKAVDDIARSLTPLEKHVTSAAKRLGDLDLSKSLSRGTNALVAESVAAIAKLDNRVLRLRDSQELLGKSFDTTHSRVTGFGAGMSRVGAIVGTTVAAVSAVGLGIFELARRSADATEQVGILSRQLGVQVQTLSALQIAGEGEKVSLQQIGTALANFEKYIGTADQGSKNHIKTLGSLKIATKDNETAIRSAFEQLNKMPDGYEKTTAAMQLFGEGGKAMLGIIKETNGNIDQAIKKYGDLGKLISTEDVRAAREFNDALRDLDSAMNEAGRSIVTGLAPNLHLIATELSLILSVGAKVIGLFAQGFAGIISPGLGAVQGRVQTTEMVIGAAADAIPNKGGSPHLPRLGGGGGRGGESAAQRAARQALEVLQVDLQQADRVAQEILDKERRLYDEGLKNLAAYTEARKKAAEDRYQAELKTFQAERDLIAKSALGGGEQSVRLRQIQEKEEAALSRRNKAINDAQAEQRQKEQDAARKHLDSLLRLRQTHDEREISEQQSLLEQGVITREAYEKRVNDIIYDSFQLRLQVIYAELAAAGENQEKWAEVYDKLIQTEEEYINANLEGLRRIGKARQEDLESVQRYAKELRDLKFENIITAIGIGRGKLERDERLGTRSPRATRREMDKLDIEEENETYNQRVLEAVEDLNQRLLSSDVDTLEKRQALLEIFYEQAALMAVEHGDRLREIQERPLVEWREKLQSIADDIGDIFGNAVREWDGSFKGFFRSVLQGFAEMLRDIAAQMMASAVSKIFANLLGAVLGGVGGGSGYKGLDDYFSNAPLPGFASGGDITPFIGQPIQVHADEKILPLAPGYVVPKGGMPGGNQTTVNHINVTLPPPRNATFRQNRSRREIAERIAGLLAA